MKARKGHSTPVVLIQSPPTQVLFAGDTAPCPTRSSRPTSSSTTARGAVVKGLNLRVPVGCVYGFLGRNGAGKSTTIRMLMGMVRPDHGHVELLGENIDTITPATRARIAYIAEGTPHVSALADR